MLRQKIRKSLTAFFGQKDYSHLTTESTKITQDARRITREDLDALTTKELQKRALYESLAEHQRLIEADEKAEEMWQD